MPDQVHFARTFGRPQINGQDVVGCVDLAVGMVATVSVGQFWRAHSLLIGLLASAPGRRVPRTLYLSSSV